MATDMFKRCWRNKCKIVFIKALVEFALFTPKSVKLNQNNMLR